MWQTVCICGQTCEHMSNWNGVNDKTDRNDKLMQTVEA
jgi:hypothetical protein